MPKLISPSLFIFFGSRNKGNAAEFLDYDIGVVADKPLGLEEKNKMISDFSKEFSFPEDKIDLVDLNEASPLLQMEVAKSGKLLKGSEEDFLKFRLFAWTRYQHHMEFRRKAEKLKTLYQKSIS